MKRQIKFLITIAVLILLSALILNLRVSYNQGINYVIRRVEVPVYLKLLDFFSRHYHYQQLVKQITASCKTKEEKVFSLFAWTRKNIREVPEGLPFVDDHVYNTIIRGYGTDDQLSDVFTTLCNYAGVEAFFTWIWSKDYRMKIPLSFVRLEGKWYIFDPHYGVYFTDNKGNLADLQTVKSGNYLITRKVDLKKIDYSKYIDNIPVFQEVGLHRANTQSPINRLLFEIKRRLK